MYDSLKKKLKTGKILVKYFLKNKKFMYNAINKIDNLLSIYSLNIKQSQFFRNCRLSKFSGN